MKGTVVIKGFYTMPVIVLADLAVKKGLIRQNLLRTTDFHLIVT